MKKSIQKNQPRNRGVKSQMKFPMLSPELIQLVDQRIAFLKKEPVLQELKKQVEKVSVALNGNELLENYYKNNCLMAESIERLTHIVRRLQNYPDMKPSEKSDSVNCFAEAFQMNNSLYTANNQRFDELLKTLEQFV